MTTVPLPFSPSSHFLMAPNVRHPPFARGAGAFALGVSHPLPAARFFLRAFNLRTETNGSGQGEKKGTKWTKQKG